MPTIFTLVATWQVVTAEEQTILPALTDFETDDLAILNRAPTAVAMAAAYAEQDGLVNLVREMQAGLSATI